MLHVTNGIMRKVLLTNRYAIKVPSLRHGWKYFLHGLLANYHEANLWACAKADGSAVSGFLSMLCPVVWASWGGWIVVMRRAEEISQQQWDATPWPDDFPVGDRKVDNFGLLDGRVVCVDYGTPLV